MPNLLSRVPAILSPWSWNLRLLSVQSAGLPKRWAPSCAHNPLRRGKRCPPPSPPPTPALPPTVSRPPGSPGGAPRVLHPLHQPGPCLCCQEEKEPAGWWRESPKRTITAQWIQCLHRGGYGAGSDWLPWKAGGGLPNSQASGC